MASVARKPLEDTLGSWVELEDQHEVGADSAHS